MSAWVARASPAVSNAPCKLNLVITGGLSFAFGFAFGGD
jgi:hypothetical protein